MMSAMIGPYLILGFVLACIVEDQEFYAWLLFWPIVVVIKAIKELIEIFLE